MLVVGFIILMLRGWDMSKESSWVIIVWGDKVLVIE